MSRKKVNNFFLTKPTKSIQARTEVAALVHFCCRKHSELIDTLNRNIKIIDVIKT